eukprot:CAMPEP_0175391998 /NCGR_PEP_ID=MMETSP0095-20121207/32198_1 /TAXON_ID=311494 /ORGANISM="Alexandrium monilatum, Strain CCMP3105" /LENGTH=38 /DNA_ID= /DNA_START= /DNA_END= /DNA_ORIENTATION=
MTSTSSHVWLPSAGASEAAAAPAPGRSSPAAAARGCGR